MLDGTVYIASVGADVQSTAGIVSILSIERRPGDALPKFFRGTKGYEGRNTAILEFLANDHDFILMLDSDMLFQPDTLEKLRAHGLPCISGFYVSRTMPPIAICREPWPDEGWPPKTWVGVPEPGRLHHIGASGWGCILIHRSVFEALNPILKGEWFVAEDDMDVWPYDLDAVLRGDEQIRPLRGDKSVIIGSDIRFGFFVHHAGIEMMMDPDVYPGHYINYPMDKRDYAGVDFELMRADRDERNAEYVQKHNDRMAALEAITRG